MPTCDMELTDNNGQNALHYAANLCCLETIQLLLDRGADASVKNNKGETARNLHEQQLPTLAPNFGGPRYPEISQQVRKRLLQLERKAAASATNGF